MSLTTDSSRRVLLLILCLVIVSGGLLSLFSALGAWAADAVAPSAIFIVDSALDATDSSPGNGVCATAAGHCTLRAAIQEANVFGGPDTIILPSGAYTLTIPGRDEDVAFSGDLDLFGQLVISGTGTPMPMVDADGLDRVFDIQDDAEVEIKHVTTRGGYPGDEMKGGGIRNEGTLTLAGGVVEGNHTTGFVGYGGGIFNDGPLLLNNSIITGNWTTGQQGYGGGIYSRQPMTITDSQVSDNRTTGKYGLGGGIHTRSRLWVIRSTITGNKTNGWNSDGGGIYGFSPPMDIISSTISYNQIGVGEGDGRGAGVFQHNPNFPDNLLRIVDSTFIGNVADGFGGGLFAGTDVVITNTTFISNMTQRGGSGGAISFLFKDISIWIADLLTTTVPMMAGPLISITMLTFSLKTAL